LIPLSDVDRRPVRFPIVTAVIIAVNCFVFVIELLKGPSFILKWAFVPRAVASGHDYINIFTAMFLHAGFLHIAGNMVYLWAFGPEIEDVMGRVRYIFFYLTGGLIAFLSYMVINLNSQVPSLGASGAIAAVMGAFLVTFPKDRIRTILIIIIFVTITRIPAILLVGFWFFIQLFSEVGSIVTKQSGGIAYMAHIGGIIFGILAAPFLEHREKIV
jgi:membrane associated rhomboid family serine protease